MLRDSHRGQCHQRGRHQRADHGFRRLGVDGDSLGAASGNRFANLQIREAISLSGADNAAELNRANYNGRAGFDGEGMGLTVRRNIGTSNALDGFEVDASASTFDRNRRDSNGLLGIADTGTDNNYVDNRCTGNDLGPSNPPGPLPLSPRRRRCRTSSIYRSTWSRSRWSWPSRSG